MTVVLFLLVFSILVLAHEAGHFFAARALGAHVEEFGIGFPPRLWVHTRKSTVYSINAIPLGGFVRLKGESGASTAPGSFSALSIGRRFVIVASGVAMNAILAYSIITALLTVGISQVIDDVPTGASVSGQHVVVVGVLDSSPAKAAGIVPGVTLRAVGEKPVSDVRSVQTIIASREGLPTTFEITRDSVYSTVAIVPQKLDSLSSRVGIGVELLSVGVLRYPFYKAIFVGGSVVGEQALLIVQSLKTLVVQAITTRQIPSDVAGPIGIARAVGVARTNGWGTFISFIALLSLNLAVLNALPIPALDGGRMLFLALEAIRRKPLALWFESRAHQIGFLLLLLLIVFVSLHDLRMVL